MKVFSEDHPIDNSIFLLGNSDSCPVQKRVLGGVETLVTEVLCDKPVAEIHFIKGFKSHPKYYEEFIQTMHDNNINVIMVTLPDPDDSIGYWENYKNIAKAVYIEGALDKSSDPPIPKFALTHSTGGLLKCDLLTDEDNAKTFKTRYKGGAIFAAPYLGNKHHRNPYYGALARALSRLMPDIPVSTSWIESKGEALYNIFNKQARQGMAIQAEQEKDEDLKLLANHRQALYMDEASNAVYNKIIQDGMPPSAMEIPKLVMIGKFDRVCLNPRIEEVADKMRALKVTVNGGHSFLRKTQDGPSLVMDYIRVRLHQIKMDNIRNMAASAPRLLPYYADVARDTRLDIPETFFSDNFDYLQDNQLSLGEPA